MSSPLQHKIFISTRPKGQSEELKQLLSASGADLLEFPMIEILPVIPDNKLTDQLNTLAAAQWLIFTSANGVRYFFTLLETSGKKNLLPENIKCAAIGKKTARVLSDIGYNVDVVAKKSNTYDLGNLLIKKISAGSRVIVVVGSLASGELENKLAEKAEVIRMEVYRTLLPEMVNESLLSQIVEDRYDQLIFTSPSAIKNFLQTAGDRINAGALRIICIGETTAAFARKSGIFPSALAESPSADGIYKSILNLYNNSK